MARDGLNAPSRSVGLALSAYSPALHGETGVCRRKGVPAAAMGLGLLFGAARVPPKGKAAEVVARFGGNNLSHRKALCGTPYDRFGLSAARQDKLADEMACAVDDDPLCVASVSLAVRLGNPAAVFGRVIPVNVDAVNQEAIRTRPHIADERMKVGEPPIAYADAASPIVLELLHPGVPTPLLHGNPNAVEGVGVLERQSGSPSGKHTSTKRQRKAE